MLFNGLRILSLLIVTIIIVIIIKKSNILHKKAMLILAFTSCFIINGLLGMFPIENLFVNFEQPEKVFNYTCSGEINDIVYAEKSCMIFYTDRNGSFTYTIIPKTKTGYKIPNYFSTKKVIKKSSEYGNYSVLNVSGISDYYIWGRIITKESNPVVVDKDNKLVKNMIVDNNDSTVKVIFIYDFLNNYTDEYSISIRNQA